MKLFLFLFSFLFFISCNSKVKPINIEGQTMGTYYKVKTYGSTEPETLKKDVDKFLKFFNDIFSTYIPDSEISQINKSEFEYLDISDTFKKLLDISHDVSNKSKGYFDVTVGPLVNAWGFGPDGKKKKPSEDQIKSLLKYTGYNLVKVKDGRIYRKPGVKLDLSAIAKGYGVDELVKFLEFRGHANLLVEIGGEVRTRGKKADKTNWKVGIEGPSENLGAKIIKVIELDNMSMATSGSYRNYLKYGDDVFNHTIDPKTGYPVKHKTISVTVLSEYCADADAWATALMSMGVEKGIEVANQYDLPVLFQVKEDGKIKQVPSHEFKKY